MLCPNCGSRCSDDAASCSRCGYRFRRPSQQSQQRRNPQQRPSQGYEDRPMRQRSDSEISAPKRRPAQSAQRVSNDPATEKKYIIVGAITLIVTIIVAVVLITSLSCICSNSCDACAKEASESAIADSVGGDEWGGVEEDAGVVDPNAAPADPNAAVDPNAAAPADPNAAAAPAA